MTLQTLHIPMQTDWLVRRLIEVMRKHLAHSRYLVNTRFSSLTSCVTLRYSASLSLSFLIYKMETTVATLLSYSEA